MPGTRLAALARQLENTARSLLGVRAKLLGTDLDSGLVVPAKLLYTGHGILAEERETLLYGGGCDAVRVVRGTQLENAGGVVEVAPASARECESRVSKVLAKWRARWVVVLKVGAVILRASWTAPLLLVLATEFLCFP